MIRQRSITRRIGADIIALNFVTVGARIEKDNAGAAIAGNHIARRGCCATNKIVFRARFDEYARVTIGQCGIARRIGANVIALNFVAIGAHDRSH